MLRPAGQKTVLSDDKFKAGHLVEGNVRIVGDYILCDPTNADVKRGWTIADPVQRAGIRGESEDKVNILQLCRCRRAA